MEPKVKLYGMLGYGMYYRYKENETRNEIKKS